GTRSVVVGGRGRHAVAARAAKAKSVRHAAHQPVDHRDRQGGHQEHAVDRRLPDQHLVRQRARRDEALEQVDRRDADDRGRQLDLQHVGVHVRQPLGLVGVAFEAEARNEGLVAADDHHDQQVRDHHDVDQRQDDDHDHRLLVALGDRKPFDGGVERGRVPQQFDQVDQFLHEEEDVDELRHDQAEVQRQLQPAAGEDQARQQRQRLAFVDRESASHGGVLRGIGLRFYRIGVIGPHRRTRDYPSVAQHRARGGTCRVADTAGCKRVVRYLSYCARSRKRQDVRFRRAPGHEGGRAMSAQIESVMQEVRLFPPPDAFRKQATISGVEQYDALCAEAAKDHAGFWARLAREHLVWHKPFSRALDDSNAPFFKWFADGELNVSYNCLDRHLGTPVENKTAIIFEADDGAVTRVTYRELHQRVSRFANAIKALGYKRGDRAIIYLPMSIHGVVAMQACARLGITHSVVFGGYSAKSLHERIIDVGATLVITADEQVRGGKRVPLKDAVDEAFSLGGCDAV